MPICTKCKLDKSPEDFYKKSKDSSSLRSSCKNCNNSETQAWFKTDKGQTYRKKIHGNLQKKKPELLLFWSCRSGAKKRNLEFTLEEKDIVIPSVCPVLGIPLFLVGGKRTDNSPSVDRVDSTRGYTKDNVRIISWRANKLKQDASLEEVEKILSYMKQNAKSIT